MERRRLGNSDLFVAPIAVGCWAFGGGNYWGEQSQRDVNEVVAAALDMGLSLFDTAEMYNAGESERSLGLALKGRREQAVVCSKVGPDNAYYDEMIAHCNMSLERLGTDYLDVYMLHWPINYGAIKHFTEDPKKLASPPTVEEAFGAMMALRASGKIRSIGISNFGVGQMREALETSAQIDVNEMPYNIFSRAIEAEILPFCVDNHISVVGSMALQQGVLAGIYSSADQVPPNQAHSRHYHNNRGGGTSRHGGSGVEAEMFAALDQLRALADEAGLTLAQMAIAWAIGRVGVAGTLVGSRTVDQLKENVSALNRPLGCEMIARIDEISRPLWDRLGDNPDYYESEKNSRIW